MRIRAIRNRSVLAAITLTLAATPASAQRPDITWMRGGIYLQANAIAYSADGSTITTADERSVKVWRVSDGILLQTVVPPGYAGSNASVGGPSEFLSSNATVLAYINSAGSVVAFRISDQTVLATITVPTVYSYALSLDGTQLAVETDGSSAHVLRIYSTAGGTLLNTIPGSSLPGGTAVPPTNIPAFSAGGVLALGDPNTLNLYTTSSTGDGSSNIWYGPESIEPNPVWSPNGQYIAAVNGSGVWLYQYGVYGDGCSYVKNQQPACGDANSTAPGVQIVTGSGFAGTAAFSADSGKLAAGIGGAEFNSPAVQSSLSVFPVPVNGPGTTINLNSFDPPDVAFSPDGNRIAAAYGPIMETRHSNDLSLDLTVTGQSGSPAALAWSPDGSILATGAADGAVRFWDAHTGAPIRSINGQDVVSIAFSPDGTKVAIGDDLAANPLSVYNVGDGSLFKNIDSSLYAAWSPDGKFFVTSRALYSTTNYTSIATFADPDVTNVAFSTDGSSVFALDDTGVSLYATSNLATPVRHLLRSGGGGSTQASAFALSPDGALVAVGYADSTSAATIGRVDLFRVTDGADIRKLVGNTEEVDSVAFSPDGQTVIASDQDGNICVWRVSDGTLLKTYIKETNATTDGSSGLEGLAYSPDGTTFAYGRGDNTVVVANNPYFAPLLTSVSFNVSSVSPGQSATGTVTLSAAPASDTTVNLTASDPALSVPATAVVTAGTKTRTFTATAGAVSKATAVTVTGSSGGAPKKTVITVQVCTYQLSPQQSSQFPSSGGTGSFSVTPNDSSCSWTATTTNNWITITSGSGTGTGTVQYSVSQNASGTALSGSITVGGASYTVTQAQAFANQPPTADSVSPNSGGANAQSFTFTYSDPNGWADLKSVYGLMNATLSNVNACRFYYQPSANALYLYNDAGTAWLGPVTPAVAGTVSNSQCTLDAGASSVSGSANTLTVKVALSFTAAFGGQKNVYGYAGDNGGLNSGWKSLGTWYTAAIQAVAPTADSVTPNGGAGTSAALTLKFSSANGYTFLNAVYGLLNGALNNVNACRVYYQLSTNRLYLYNDAGTAWLGPVTPAVAGTVSNSQCTLDGGASSVSGSANTLSVKVALSFTGGFAGVKTVYGYAADNGGLNSGWKTLGTWNTAAPQAVAPTADSVTPNGGAGTSAALTFKFSSVNGYGYLNAVYGLINGTLSNVNGCRMYYQPSTNRLYLYNDAGTAWLGPLTPAVAGTLSNSQCTLDAGASSVSGSANTLSVKVALSFNPGFAALKNVYGYAADSGGLNSGWKTLGTWNTVAPQAVPPTADSVAPNAGTGTSAAFTFRFSSVNSYGYLNAVYGLINGTLSSVNGCRMYYQPSTNRLYLYNDAGSAALGGLTPGAAGTVSNTQCTLDAGASSVSGSANTLSVKVALSFAAGFAGGKTVYGYAADNGGLNSGWKTLGTWNTATVQAVAPTADSVAPNGGAGTSAPFTFKFSSVNGYAYLNSVYGLINRSLSSVNACRVYYQPSTNRLYLYNDAGTVASLGPLTPGVAGTVSNSQCTLDAGASSVSGSANTLTVKVALSFTAGFTGLKNVYGYAADNGGLNSGWKTLGTWSTGP